MTVCGGSDVIDIQCGYDWPSMLPVTWVINGISFDQSAIMNSSSYQLNTPSIPSSNSLLVYSINDTTTFQCIVHSNPDVTSTLGIVTVINGMYMSYNLHFTFIIFVRYRFNATSHLHASNRTPLAKCSNSIEYVF